MGLVLVSVSVLVLVGELSQSDTECNLHGQPLFICALLDSFTTLFFFVLIYLFHTRFSGERIQGFCKLFGLVVDLASAAFPFGRSRRRPLYVLASLAVEVFSLQVVQLFAHGVDLSLVLGDL